MFKRKLNRGGAVGTVLIGAVALGGGALAVTPAFAASPVAASSPQGNAAANAGPDQQDPSYTSSIRINESTPDQTDAQLQAKAKITADQAKGAAIAKFPGGTVQSVDIEDENGNLVYGVALTDASHAAQDVKVDAGNGAVVNVQAGGDDAKESGAEAPEAGETASAGLPATGSGSAAQ